MARRKQVYVLAGLLAVLAAVVLYNSRSASALVPSLSGDETFTPLPVVNPALRLDRIERIRKLAYPGPRRNLFSGELPAPPQPPKPVTPPVTGPTTPVEQPLQVPFKFYGFAADPRSGKRRAFFTNGDEVYIAAEGETVLNRFRVLRIGNTTADVEEISTGKRATLAIEQAAQPQG